MNAEAIEDFYGRLQSPLGRFLLSSVAMAALVFVLWYVFFGPNYISTAARSRHMTCPYNLKEIATALELYSADNEGFYPENLAEIVPKYLEAIPECGAARADTYTTSYRSGPDAPLNDQKFATYYYLHCEGHHHKRIGGKPNRPAYSAIEGLIQQ